MSLYLFLIVWYAKRFKMTTKWGYRLPTRSSSMGLKSLWKRAKTSAVLSDNSYYPVLELLCIDIDALAPFLSKFLVRLRGFIHSL